MRKWVLAFMLVISLGAGIAESTLQPGTVTISSNGVGG